MFLNCALKGRPDLLYTILSKEPAFCNIQDENGCTALHWACAQGQLDCVRVLLLAGTDVWAQNGKEHTALHIAAKYGKQDCCLELLDAAGLQLLEVLCTEGYTAVDVAHRQTPMDMCALSSLKDCVRGGMTPLLPLIHCYVACCKALCCCIPLPHRPV